MRISESGTEAAWWGLRREYFDYQVVATFTVDGEPASKSRARFTKQGSKVHAYTPKKTKAAEEVMAWKFHAAAPKHQAEAENAYGVIALFFCATRQRRDVDNMLKLVLDGLNGVAWEDDSQVIEVSGRKDNVQRDPGQARTEVLIYRLGRDDPMTAGCEQCGTQYKTYASWIEQGRRFCSQACDRDRRRAERTKPCASCGELFVSEHKRKFCSDECRSKGHRVTVVCASCGKSFQRWTSLAAASRRSFCSPACQQDFQRPRRAKSAEGSCADCGGPTSKAKYIRCQACAVAARSPKQSREREVIDGGEG